METTIKHQFAIGDKLVLVEPNNKITTKIIKAILFNGTSIIYHCTSGIIVPEKDIDSGEMHCYNPRSSYLYMAFSNDILAYRCIVNMAKQVVDKKEFLESYLKANKKFAEWYEINR